MGLHKKLGRLLKTDGKFSCKCCSECDYYACTLCNTGCCANWDYTAYICTTFQCSDEYGLHDLENGDVISGNSGGQDYCFVVNTGTVYCPDGGEGCEPLPKGAPILDPTTVACVPNCSEAVCPPIPCYYVGVACSCTSENVPPIYVLCSAWREAQELGPCPVYGVCIGGECWCIYVREESTPTELPDPLPPNAIVIETGEGWQKSCCECCGFLSQEECCYTTFNDFTETWNSNCTNSIEFHGVSHCCGATDSWCIHVVGSWATFYANDCPNTLYTWDCVICPGISGDTGTYHFIQYTGDCSGISYESDGPIFMNYCAASLGMETPGTCAGEGSFQSGTYTASCDHGEASIIVDNTAGGGQRQEFNATYTVTAAPGTCNNDGCGPLTDEMRRSFLLSMPNVVHKTMRDAVVNAPVKKGKCGGCSRRKRT